MGDPPLLLPPNLWGSRELSDILKEWREASTPGSLGVSRARRRRATRDGRTSKVQGLTGNILKARRVLLLSGACGACSGLVIVRWLVGHVRRHLFNLPGATLGAFGGRQPQAADSTRDRWRGSRLPVRPLFSSRLHHLMEGLSSGRKLQVSELQQAGQIHTQDFHCSPRGKSRKRRRGGRSESSLNR